ncbi:V-type ATP synthase subunit B [Proteocatella sphenisci]|uniref:V-type ATP synthase subunit B n=1 Tax=Proteocatella sphenisci TaxID=181070 RepID=UPI00048C6B6D|nr:V-type ATP synthase subunit B [Proteocatella sphenisci]
MANREYLKLDRVKGDLIVLEGVEGVAYGEILEITLDNGLKRDGKVVTVDGNRVIAQVFQGTQGISTSNASVKFAGKPLEIALSRDILGRSFNGIGKPYDGAGPIYCEKKYNVNGRPVNPVSREYPRNYLETGISAIDSLMTLIRGQKLPIFSGNGLSHNELAAQIVRQASVKGEDSENFAVVFAAMGVKHDDADFFRKSFEGSGVIQRVVMYVNLADDPVIERITTPRCAMTAAEYLAYEEGMHVLVILTDMTSYAEALREISSSREEVPSRKGYPGYLYSDLATIYERAGMIRGKAGSVTLLPILTMPNDDITHPIPDLSGYITEGQIVLSRDLQQKNIYPPINVLPSLSRLMKDGIGEGFTRDDHDEVASQLFSSYSRVQDVRSLAQIIGEDDLSEIDRKFLAFGVAFEKQFLSQKTDEKRTIEETLDIAWDILGILPPEELERLSPQMMEKYYTQR